MKKMIILLSILSSLFTACEKPDIIPETTPNYLPGNWGLYKTELFVSDTLHGSVIYNEITTYYQFDSCATVDTCWMWISEDGESEAHTYLHNQDSAFITLDGDNQYDVDLITDTELILSKVYGDNKSIWSFNKDN